MTEGAGETARVGELLAGKYKIQAHLGSGAMGDVYRAQNTVLGREVAIKVLRPEHAHNEEIVGRFMREAKAANLVRHPNVVDMLDVGKDHLGSPFIVQEFLRGKDFAKYIEDKGNRLSPEDALTTLIPVVEAIEYAHARGVVHRDLKPENIFLADEGGDEPVPKLLDFGISQIRDTTQVRMTSTGLMMGTPAYMSPEQITQGARETDAQTDVWALGVILWEVLGGRLPFMAETASALFVEIATKDIRDVRTVAPHVSESLARIVHRCLRRDRKERYPSGCELARDLRLEREGLAPEPTQKLSVIPGPNVDRKKALVETQFDTSEDNLASFEREVPDRAGLDRAPLAPALPKFDLELETKPKGRPSGQHKAIAKPAAPLPRPSGQVAAVRPPKPSGLHVDRGAPVSARGAAGPQVPSSQRQMAPPSPMTIPGKTVATERDDAAQSSDVVGIVVQVVTTFASAGLLHFILHTQEAAVHPMLMNLGAGPLVVGGCLALIFVLGTAVHSWTKFRAKEMVVGVTLAVMTGTAICTAWEAFGNLP